MKGSLECEETMSVKKKINQIGAQSMISEFNTTDEGNAQAMVTASELQPIAETEHDEGEIRRPLVAVVAEREFLEREMQIDTSEADLEQSYWKNVSACKRRIKYLRKQLEKEEKLLNVYYEGVRAFFE